MKISALIISFALTFLSVDCDAGDRGHNNNDQNNHKKFKNISKEKKELNKQNLIFEKNKNKAKKRSLKNNKSGR